MHVMTELEAGSGFVVLGYDSRNEFLCVIVQFFGTLNVAT